MEKASQKSEFTGKFWGMFGTMLVCALMSIFTLTIATPWAICKFIKWKTEHTYVNGQQLKFDGKGGQLFGKIIVWFLLSIITIGIYAFIVPIKFFRWQAENTTLAAPLKFSGFMSSQPTAAPSTTTPAAPVGTTTPSTANPNLAPAKAPTSNLSAPSGVSTTATPNGQAPRPVQPTLAGPRPVQPGVQPRPVSPLTQAPTPRPAPAPAVTPKKTAGLGAAIFAFIFAIVAAVVFAVGYVLPLMPELAEMLPVAITPDMITYIFYAAAGIGAFGLLLSFIGMGKFGKEKKRSGAKPVATLIISILAMLECLAIIFIAVCFALPMLSAMKELIASYLSLFIVV
jgi:hypothetical protein